MMTRRNLLATGASLAAISVDQAIAVAGQAGEVSTGSASATSANALKGPFDTLRDYISALDAAGLLLRFDRVDQDAYEASAIMYRLRDKFGMWGAPAFLAEELKIDGEWVKGPVIFNDQGPAGAECVAFGVDPVHGDVRASYRKAVAYFMDMLEASGGSFVTIDPVDVPAERALCKQVILRGDDIDLTRFAFIKGNPGDAGRYINTGMVFTEDPDMGKNFGTYRCQLKGPREISVNSEPNQSGWKMLMAATERGEKIAKVSIVLSADPVIWMISSTRVGGRRGDAPVDELAVAGGIKGRAIQVVRSETNDHMIPANAEMVIEGEIPLGDYKPEGPYGEMLGYQGRYKAENFWMTVTAVTHRKDPWIMNNFTGVNRGAFKAAGTAMSRVRFKRLIPEIVDFHTASEAVGMTYISIDKTKPGQGLEVGEKIARSIPLSKIVVVVDKDLDVLNHKDMLFAMGSRWQPNTASRIFDELRGMPLDPSLVNRPMTSKIVIDATKQLPEEGGPEKFAELNRTLLVEGAPGAFDLVDEKWGEIFNEFARSQLS
ncbi:MAG: UbiD family decarboxylase [Gammaproteobacteria bacterium]|nr:UbiD family decarboxylase [Gammaproteobacteria bacterium]